MKKILVPTDFSAPAEEALRYALQFGSLAGANEIILLHSAYIPINPAETFVPVTNMLYEDSGKMMDALQAKAREWPETEGFTFTPVVMVDDMITSIRKASQNLNPDYIVMGTKGASGVQEFLFGTNAADVLEQSDVPVIVVPPQTVFKKPVEIVFAADLQNIPDMEVLATLKNLAIACESRLMVLHISQDLNLTAEELKEKEKLKDYFHGLDFYVQVLHSESIYTGIEIYLQDHSPDMMAVLSRRHGFFDKIFRASISKKVAHRTIIPLLSLRETN